MKMKFLPLLLVAFTGCISPAPAQVAPDAGAWKTWFIPAGKDYRLPAPAAAKSEKEAVWAAQQALDSAGMQQIYYWNAGAPGYRWQNMMFRLWMSADGADRGALAYMLLGAAIYDATVAAWDTKYAWKRPRPYEVDPRIRLLIPRPESPAYPCEHSVAAGAAYTIISHFYPQLADSVQRMAQRVMNSRVAAGAVFPSDAKAGFELGKKVALAALEYTRDFLPTQPWDGIRPDIPGMWKGDYPAAPLAGKFRTVVLKNGSQFRPGPPPDYAKDMEELKNFKPNFMSSANAFFYATQSFWDDLLHKKIFEYNLHLNPPLAARMYAIAGIGYYDGFVACWDAKYAYWGTRPDQYDTTYHPVIMMTPPFPGYPSGHAAISAVLADLYSDFFPAEKAFFQRKAKEAAESRFQAGIHFRTDNEVGLELGHKVAAEVIRKVQADKELEKQPTVLSKQ